MRLLPESPRARAIVALAAGAVWPLGFAPFGMVPVPIVSLAMLMLCLRGQPARRATFIGWLFGAGMFGTGVSWIQISVHQFGIPYLAFSVGVTILLIAYLALYPALFAWAGARCFAGDGALRSILWLPGLWTVTEWLREVLLTGFPWLAIGYSQIDSPLAGLAPIAGVHASGFAAAVSAGLLALLVARGRVVRRQVLAGFLAIWVAGLIAGLHEWTRADGKPMSVSIVQGNIEQSVKWSRELREFTIERYRTITRIHWGRDLIVWPETAIPAFHTDVRPELDALQQQAERTGTTLMVGVPVMKDDRQYFNGVLALGTEPGLYLKRHLVPFGEYMPLQPLLGRLIDVLRIPMSSFSAGDSEQDLLVAAGRKVGVSICYEDAFGSLIRAALPQAALLVNVSNDAWFGNSLAPHQHLEIARMRALEAGRWLLRATNTGISAVIDPRGRVATRSPQFEAWALTAEIEPRTGATPYVKYGDLPLVIACALLCVAGAVLTRRT
ncbi:MAG: apolipoprotein N-acyltransferase [Gammaproteobacteria bacterium]